MTLDPRLLSILRCPTTGRSLRMLKDQELERLHHFIAEGIVGEALNDVLKGGRLTAALITDNASTIYPIIDGVPVLLEAMAMLNTHLPEPISG